MASADSTLGGDPASIRAIADWMRGSLIPAVAGCASTAERMLDRRAEVWEDDAAAILHEQLTAGHRKTQDLVDALGQRARVLDRLADVLEFAQRQMQDAVRLAEEAELPVQDGWIQGPGWEAGERGPVEWTEKEKAEYLRQVAAFDHAKDLVASAQQEIVDTLVGDTSYDWNELMFMAGDFVKEYSAELARKDPARYGYGGGILSRLTERTPRPVPVLATPSGGLVAKVLRGSWIMTPIGVAYDIASGDPPEEALFVAGVGMAGGAGAGVLWLVVGGPGGWMLAAVIAVGSLAASSGASWVLDAKTARDKLLQAGVDMNPGTTGLPG